MRDWIERFKENGDFTLPKILIGNKCDLDRKVSEADAKKLAAELECEYFETSAKTRVNCDESFKHLFDLAYAKLANSGERDGSQSIKINARASIVAEKKKEKEK